MTLAGTTFATGTLNIPSRVMPNYRKHDENQGYTNAVYSDDHGKTWYSSAPFPLDGTGESGLVELSDGTIYLNSRTHTRAGNRWIAYSDPDLATVWVSPLVATGQRFQVATGSVAEPRWRSNREIVINAVDDSTTILRMGMDASRASPVFTRLGTIGMPGYVETAGLSYGLTPDGRILYVRTAKDEPKRFLRVVPDWVAQMKQAVDEANR